MIGKWSVSNKSISSSSAPLLNRNFTIDRWPLFAALDSEKLK
jgi:hypothetical protein